MMHLCVVHEGGGGGGGVGVGHGGECVRTSNVALF